MQQDVPPMGKTVIIIRKALVIIAKKIRFISMGIGFNNVASARTSKTGLALSFIDDLCQYRHIFSGCFTGGPDDGLSLKTTPPHVGDCCHQIGSSCVN